MKKVVFKWDTTFEKINVSYAYGLAYRAYELTNFIKKSKKLAHFLFILLHLCIKF
jgi:hypothetical protein